MDLQFKFEASRNDLKLTGEHAHPIVMVRPKSCNCAELARV